MRIGVELGYFDSCPNWQLALERLHEAAAAEGVKVAARLRQVESLATTAELEFHGSPTLMVGGRDPFVDADDSIPAGLTCRLYPTPDGIQGAPSAAQLRRELRELGGGEQPTTAYSRSTTSS